MEAGQDAIDRLLKAGIAGAAVASLLADADARRWQIGVSVARSYKNLEPSLREFYADLEAAKEAHEQCSGLLQTLYRTFRDTAIQMLAVAIDLERHEDLSRPSFLSFHTQLAIDARRLKNACEAALSVGKAESTCNSLAQSRPLFSDQVTDRKVREIAIAIGNAPYRPKQEIAREIAGDKHRSKLATLYRYVKNGDISYDPPLPAAERATDATSATE